MGKVKRTGEGGSGGMDFGIALHAVIPMRKKPSETSEMVSQLLFGETYRVIRERDSWMQITTVFDNYGGWIDRKLYRRISRAEVTGMQSALPVILAARVAEVELPDTTSMIIPGGSILPAYNPAEGTISVTGLQFRIRPPDGGLIPGTPERIADTANGFLNSPYLWGGRSPFGFDCSGFVQLVYRIHGIDLPRDTRQQVEFGQEVGHIREARTGDLAFFAHEPGRISHVGMLLSPGEIIHCSGWVRNDGMDARGITDRQAGVLTHHLACLRRLSATIR